MFYIFGPRNFGIMDHSTRLSSKKANLFQRVAVGLELMFFAFNLFRRHWFSWFANIIINSVLQRKLLNHPLAGRGSILKCSVLFVKCDFNICKEKNVFGFLLGMGRG